MRRVKHHLKIVFENDIFYKHRIDFTVTSATDDVHGRIQMGGHGVQTPSPRKSQNIGFLSSTDPDPLKKNKATKHAGIQCRAILGWPAKRNLNGVLLAG